MLGIRYLQVAEDCIVMPKISYDGVENHFFGVIPEFGVLWVDAGHDLILASRAYKKGQICEVATSHLTKLNQMSVPDYKVNFMDLSTSSTNSDEELYERIRDAFDGNLWEIETTLRNSIKGLQKSLLGEIGLDDKREFKGQFFSFTDLSNFLISSKTVRSNLIKNPIHAGTSYLAATTIWLVNLAKNMEDGTKLWKDAFEEKALNAKLPEIFDHGMEELLLERFDGKLEGKHKYVDLARIHAIVPTYALPKFVAEVRKAATYHKSKDELINSMIESSTVPASVKLLCELSPEMTIDLLNMSIDTMRLGINVGLPQRIADALLSEASLRPLASRSRVKIPSIRLVNDTLTTYDEEDWLFRLDGREYEILENEPPLGKLECSKDGNYWFTIYDTHKNFLIFDGDRQVTGLEIPQNNPILVYSEAVSLNENELAVDPVDLNIWRRWQFANLHVGKELLIEVAGDKILLPTKKGISFKLASIPNIRSADYGYEIYSEYPNVNSGKNALVRDEITNESKIISEENEPLWDDDGGYHQFIVRGGLGNSKKVSGLFVPGLKISGIDRSLVEGESRKVRFELPGGWSGKSEITIVGNQNNSTTSYVLTDPDGFDYELNIEIPLLNWSIAFEDNAPVQNYKTARFSLNKISMVRSLVIHDCYGDYKPDINIISMSQREPETRGPKRSTQDLRYDLKLKDANEKNGLKLTVLWDYKEVDLAVFQDVVSRASKRQANVFTSFADLKEIYDTPGFFSEEELDNYKKEKAAEMAMWKMQLRKKISRGFDE